MIPANIIEDLKYRNSIEDVISSYVNLTRSGSNLKGLCPFHSEKTPSFTVYSGDGHFYCFGCGAGGDVVSFIMRIENLEYRPALEFLAKRAGITLPDDDVRQNGGVTRSRVLEMNLEAAKYFRSVLFSPEGAPGRAYFEKRKLSGATIKHFGLGYAPDSFDSLKRHLRSKGFTDEEMVAGYLCQRSRKNEKNTYDCFRNRVMFPIIDTAGNVVAFGGRVLDDSVPKYLNSADTPAFKKSRNLFALNYARNHTDDGFILCEGYMDVIALHAAGFENAVATLGTAITADQARIMKKYTDKVIISYDSDEAGQKAADKAFRLLGEAGIDAKVLSIPGAKDPDENIKTYGAEKFRGVLSGSKTEFDFRVSRTLAKYNVEDPAEKAKAARELCRSIAEIGSRVERDIYIQNLAKKLELDPKSVAADVNGMMKRRAAEKKKAERGEIVRELSGIGNRTDPDYAKNVRSSVIERTVIGLLIIRPEYLKTASELTPEDFASSLNSRLFSAICELAENGGFDFGMLSERFTQEEISEAEKMAQKRRGGTSNGEDVMREAVKNLKEESERRRLKESGGDLMSLIESKRKNK